MSAFRRKKVIVMCCIAVVAVVSLQRWTDWSDTKATWKNSVMMKLKKYQIELQQTIDFSNNNHENTSYVMYDQSSKRRRVLPPELLNLENKRLANINALFDKAKNCLRRSQHKIAIYLHKAYETEFSMDFNFKLKKNPILEPDCKPGIDLIIIITTRPGAFYQRTAIRNAWGRVDAEINKHIFRRKPFNYKTIFTVGRDKNYNIGQILEEENTRYKDILRLDYEDTYENLTNKTMLTLEWIANKCPPKYVLKTDDDCFVNIIAIPPWLGKLKPNVKYIGKKNDYMPVIRKPWHRNYVPFADYGDEFYKPYCAGGGYMLAGEVLQNVTIRAKNIKQIINEDAYLGMVMNSLKIFPTDDERFLPFIFSKRGLTKRSMCDWKNQFLMHGVSPEKQLKMHWNALAMIDVPSLCDEMS